jgi:serine-threonine kinase receptor-associated protein
VDRFSRTLAVTASGDFSAKLWSVSTGKELYDFKHKHIVKSADFSRDTLRIATGCQDGLVRIFDTCRPEASPHEIRVSPSGVDQAVIKLQWSLSDPTLLYVAKKSSVIEVWDTRVDITGTSSATLMSPQLGSKPGCPVIDMELHPDRIVAACDTKVLFLSVSDLTVQHSIDMPAPMHFREEGGASLSPDGSKVLAVSNIV